MRVRRLTDEQSYKDAGEALRRKQDKEREAAGLPPVQRLGARAAAPQRGQRGAAGGRGGQRGGPARAAAPVARGGSSRTFHQPDKNIYVHLLGHLRKKSLLPVVVFTLSKKRCEENASTLTNADLCSAVEKSEIHVALEKAFSRLKGIFICSEAFLWTWLTRACRKRQATPTNSPYARAPLSWNWGTSRRFIAHS